MNHAPRPDLDEALRRALAPEPAPAELRAKLLAQAARPVRGWTFLRAGLLAAAAALVVGFGALLAPRLGPAGQGKVPLDAALAGASQEFDGTCDLCFKEAACAGKGCGDWAQIRAGFRAPLPACVAEGELHGGGACRIAGRSAVHYLLRDGRVVYVLPEELEACKGGERATLDRASFTVQAWNEQGRGYLLLARK